MKRLHSIRVAGLALAFGLALLSMGCETVVGVGYPGPGWGPYGGGPVYGGTWGGGPMWR